MTHPESSQNPADPPSPGTTRLCVVQPLVPHYRVPVFEQLAQAPGIDLEVWAGLGAKGGSLEAAAPTDAFRSVAAPQKRIGPFISQPKQLEAVAQGRFNVVILSWNARYRQLSKALRLARKNNVRTILWGHGYSKHESWLRQRNRDRYLKLADACLTYNHTAAEALIKRGHPRAKVFVALNAIDQSSIAQAREHWLNNPEALAAFQRDNDLPVAKGQDRPDVVLFVSRLEPDKRVDVLLQAFACVVKTRPSARLVIIGRGPEQPTLESLAQSLGIASSVRFTGAVYKEHELAPWFLSAAVFAYPVAIGLSILHAFGYGVPVVTSDNIAAHNPEIESLRPDENGCLYRDGDIDDFAAVMLRLLDDSVLQKRMSDAARATVTGPNGFTIERMVRGFVDAIRYVTNLAAREQR